MNTRVRIKIKYTNRSSLLGLIIMTLVGIAVLYLLASTKHLVAASGLQELSLRSSEVSETTSTVTREYYIAQEWYLGSEAKTACTTGFHFASIWEVLDISNLKYNADLGLTLDDSGQGPPSYIGGWIRTGYTSDSTNTPGLGNCSIWTISDDGYSGSVAYLPIDWSVGGNFDNWYVYGQQCDATMHVWCVEDVFGEKLFLPLLLKD